MGDEDLRRYTDLTALFYLLAECKLTLLDPRRWDDKNDSYCLYRYRKEMGLQTVLALCFVQSSERYHLWRVFGAGTSGVRIKFKRKTLLDAVDKVRGLKHGEVEYLTLKQISGSPKVDRLPFVKRYGFQDEEEYRLAYGSKDKLPKFDLSIPPDCIESVRLNPWLDAGVFKRVEQAIRSVDSCWSGLTIVRSSLIDNDKWRAFADRARRAKP